jgi:sigma-B regulation protein RsbU (phosphoserine phosphatase)
LTPIDLPDFELFSQDECQHNLAVQPDGDFPAAPAIQLEPGELLLLLTDGIGEAHGPDGQLFGIDRVLDVVRAHQSRTAREIVDSLYEAAITFCNVRSQLDDMTAIVVKATAS